MSKLCKRILLILAVFSSFLTLFACSAIQIDTYHVELPQDKYQLRVGQEIEALPIVSKNGQECDLEVSYHSYDASIATYVDGKIVALKSGEVRIKVTLKNNSKVYATALVTVVNDDSLIVDFNYEKTMIKGTTQLLTYELLVEKNRKLTFTSSNENVATIDELGNIKAITVGTTTIETVVSSLYDEGVSKTYKLVIEVKDLTFAINYVLDGGTNSENNPNEYVPEKLPLLLENPTKSGYKFVGWYDNENFTGEAITEISAGTMGDVTLYAKWNALDYRISYELNGGTNAENPDGYDVSDLPVSLHAPSRTGYIFKGWYMGENRVLAIPVGTTGNVVVSAKWEPITYTIDFDTNGGLPTLSSIDYTIESDSFTLQEITKVGYTFDGWYNGETKVTEITTGTYGNMTLFAKWTADLYTISYDLADGVNNPENPTSYTIESGLITLKDPTREGYTFAGWYNGEQLVTTIDSNTLENITLTAKWKITTDHEGTEVDPYSVDDALKVAGTLTKGNSTTDKYYIKGIVSEITELSTSYGNATFKITVDGKTILVFRAKNEGNQNFTSTDDLYVGDEVVIYGNITNYNGTLEITNCYVVSNNKVARPEPIEEPEVVDKTLQEIIDMDDATNKETSYKITVIVLGWGKSLTSYDAASNKYGNMIVSDLEGLNKIVVFGATATISALVWDSTNGKYTYTNKQDFLTNAITKSINIGDTLELIVIRDSYNGNTQLNAIVTKVTPKPAVTSNLIFDLDGGTCADLPTSYEEGNELSLPTPTKEGYDFLGWEYNGTIITSITATMTGDLTLTAKWKESGTTLYFEKVTSVNDITDDGLYLIVYENGEKAYAFNSSLATLDATNNYKELALTALGIAVDDASNSVTFRITKNTDGTFAILSASNNYIYYSGSKNGLNQTSTKSTAINNITIDTDGYILITSSSSTLKFNETSNQMRFRYYSSGQSSISLYKYSITTSDPSKTHNINYNLPEGATNSNPTSYTEGDTITLVDPVLSGYTFEGWYDNAECTGTKITEISGYTTDITLYAKFSVDSGTKTTKWKLVTDASELSAGDEIVIASNGKSVITGDLDPSKNFLKENTTVTFNDDKTEITSIVDAVSIYILGGKADAWTLTNSDGKLLGASAVKKMTLGSGTSTWKITIANKNATISSTNNSYGRILHNVNATRFLNYTSNTNTNMLLPQIYKKVVE